MKTAKYHNQGLSLIELMIAMIIGLVLMLGVIQIFAATRASYALSEGLSRAQENGRFAMDIIQRDLRLAGHFGCINDMARFSEVFKRYGTFTNHLNGTALDFDFSVQGYEANNTAAGNTLTLGSPAGGWAPALPAWVSGLSPAPASGSDILVLRYLSQEGVPLQGVNNNSVVFNPAHASALTENGVANPGLFGLADCTNVNIFAGTIAGGTVAADSTGNAPAVDRLQDFFPHDTPGTTQLYRANVVAYYVANGAGGGPSLWRARLGKGGAATTEELVEGIESLQLMYGLDKAKDFNQSAATVEWYNMANSLGTDKNQWRRVGLVRVGLLARSPDKASVQQAADANNRPRLWGLTIIPPNDGNLRIPYETSVVLRNRLFEQN